MHEAGRAKPGLQDAIAAPDAPEAARDSSATVPIHIAAEWAPRTASLLAWPGAALAGGSNGGALLELYRELITRLRLVEPLYLLVPPDQRASIARRLGGESSSLQLEPLLTNDIWMRDAAPLSGRRPDGQAVFLDGGFNGWGNKFPHELDRLLPLILARRWGLPLQRLPFRVEGGAIETNGRGLWLSTRSVLLNPNRANPPQDELESALLERFGGTSLFWLDGGLVDDDTDGHIDNLARFVKTDTLLCLRPESTASRDSTVLEVNRRRLQALLSDGRISEIVELPHVRLPARHGRRAPASYLNFYMAPGLVLVPVFGQNSDDEALACFRAVLPGWQVEGLDARALVYHGGGLHCITQALQLD